MAEFDDGCLPAREAINRIGELELSLNTLRRRFNSDETDRIRLGERVTATETDVTEHIAVSNQAIKKLNDTLNALETTIKAAIATPPLPTGAAVLKSWSATPVSVRAKLGGAIIGALASVELLRSIIKTGFELLAHLIK